MYTYNKIIDKYNSIKNNIIEYIRYRLEGIDGYNKCIRDTADHRKNK